MNIQLLPRGEFLITKEDGQNIKGRFTTTAIDRFCDLIGIDSYFILLSHISIGMKVGQYADFVLCAIQDYYRSNPDQCPLKRQDIMDIFDDMGGLTAPNFLSLIKHGVGRITPIKEEKKETEADKKKAGNSTRKKQSR